MCLISLLVVAEDSGLTYYLQIPTAIAHKHFFRQPYCHEPNVLHLMSWYGQHRWKERIGRMKHEKEGDIAILSRGFRIALLPARLQLSAIINLMCLQLSSNI